MPAAMITEAEDSEGRKWALKRIQSDSQSVREAERLVKLRKHPLVVPLQSIFMDGGVTFLQMPFYRNGDLRTWVEKIKVCCTVLMCGTCLANLLWEGICHFLLWLKRSCVCIGFWQRVVGITSCL